MKKIAMLTVKGAIGLLPLTIKNKLKSNHKLTEFYSKSLQRSGLFYGFPSKKKRMAMYGKYQQQQNQTVTALASGYTTPDALQVIIVGNSGVEVTLGALSRLRLSSLKVIVVGESGPRTDVLQASRLSGAIDRLDKGAPVLLLNAGDTLHQHALKLLFHALSTHSLVYCDTDMRDKQGKLSSPHFLPDWNPELFYSTAYIDTGVLVTAAALQQVRYTDVQSIAGLVAELAFISPAISMGHVPYTVVHRSSKSAHIKVGLNDVSKVLTDQTPAALAYNEALQVNHVQWPVTKNPLVSLIIPTKNGKDLVKACIDSILTKTTYKHYEILLIDNGSDEPDSLAYFESLKQIANIRVLSYPGPFNYSAINNFGVQHAKGDVVGLVNNDIEVIKPDWLTFMVGHAIREDIGCVGAKLIYSDGRIQHGGVVLGYGGGAGHAHKYFPRYHPGYMKRLIATQNYSAVTAACLLVKKSLFNAVGGLNEKDLTVAFNDVDFCLRIKEAGVRNVYCAEAELYHHESVSRGLDIAPEKAARFQRELTYLQTKWADVIAHDPAYSPNLTLKRENFSIKEYTE
ncbi:glycosyltransferase family 2 protein [Alteromonas sp. C1M14]|uniref:glycosyltransferase family 2 protein n=1 Tax=Alteromonas sp. C1M14 TaxID=2841567 RepID=UPI001C09809A|nr:glycosyltransferase family 2 protein [Alteromonas sp. C1M14]MBU2977213.1 glycosyltransferase family 2 protein [Alteromonas sp. C1M14]